MNKSRVLSFSVPADLPLLTDLVRRTAEKDGKTISEVLLSIICEHFADSDRVFARTLVHWKETREAIQRLRAA